MSRESSEWKNILDIFQRNNHAEVKKMLTDVGLRNLFWYIVTKVKTKQTRSYLLEKCITLFPDKELLEKMLSANRYIYLTLFTHELDYLLPNYEFTSNDLMRGIIYITDLHMFDKFLLKLKDFDTTIDWKHICRIYVSSTYSSHNSDDVLKRLHIILKYYKFDPYILLESSCDFINGYPAIINFALSLLPSPYINYSKCICNLMCTCYTNCYRGKYHEFPELVDIIIFMINHCVNASDDDIFEMANEFIEDDEEEEGTNDRYKPDDIEPDDNLSHIYIDSTIPPSKVLLAFLKRFYSLIPNHPIQNYHVHYLRSLLNYEYITEDYSKQSLVHTKNRKEVQSTLVTILDRILVCDVVHFIIVHYVQYI